jgi:hypothetical protein
MEREALKIALDYVLRTTHWTEGRDRHDTLKAINAALAQPAQEPMCPECKAGVLYECVACSSNNYPPQGAQKPVAWMYDWLCEGKLITGWIAHSDSEIPQLMGSNIRPLYTAPPQRTWVEPTVGEWFKWWCASPVADAIEAEIDFADFLIIAQAVVAKLKEKNT